jgi:hypothetical protein
MTALTVTVESAPVPLNTLVSLQTPTLGAPFSAAMHLRHCNFEASAVPYFSNDDSVFLVTAGLAPAGGNSSTPGPSVSFQSQSFPAM